MKLEITLNQEQADALATRVSVHNAGSESPLTAEQYLADVVLAREIESYVKQAYSNAVSRLEKSAATLPYAERVALIASIENQMK